MRAAPLVLVLAVAVAGARGATAAPQLLVFTGHVTEVEDLRAELDGSIEVGTEFTARYLVNERSVWCEDLRGTNVCTGPVYELEVSLGSYTLWAEGAGSLDELVSENAHVWIFNDGPQEPDWPDGAYTYDLRMRNATILEGPPIDTPGAVWTEVVLIAPDESHRETLDFFVPDSLDGWTHRLLSFKAVGGFDVQGVIETLTVPEPSPILLGLSAATCLGTLARRRRASRAGSKAGNSPS